MPPFNLVNLVTVILLILHLSVFKKDLSTQLSNELNYSVFLNKSYSSSIYSKFSEEFQIICATVISNTRHKYKGFRAGRMLTVGPITPRN